MRLSPDALVLEVGAGPGFFSPYIADAVPQGRSVTLDLQIEMLRMARGRLGGHPATSFVQADAMRLPFRTGAFDAVLVATVLGEVPSTDSCLAEVRRVLRQRGAVSVAETRRDSDFIRLQKLTELVEPHSFAFLDRSGTRWQYVARFEAV